MYPHKHITGVYFRLEVVATTHSKLEWSDRVKSEVRTWDHVESGFETKTKKGELLTPTPYLRDLVDTKPDFVTFLLIFWNKIYEIIFDKQIYEIICSELGNSFFKIFSIIWAFTAP